MIFIPDWGGLFTLCHCNSVRATEQKSLRFVRDMKSDPVCAIPGKAECKQQIRYTQRESLNSHYKFDFQNGGYKKTFMFALTAASVLQILSCLYALNLQYCTTRRQLQKMILSSNYPVKK